MKHVRNPTQTQRPRTRGTGSVQFKRRAGGGGTWYAVVFHNGRHVWRKAGPKKADAQRLLNRLLADRDMNNTVALDGGVPLSAYAPIFLQKARVQKLKSSTFTDYKRVITNVLVPALGAKALAAIEPADVEELISGRMEGYAPIKAGTRTRRQVSAKTALNEVAVLSALMSSARRDGLVSASPCSGIEKPKHDPRPRVVLRESELRRLIAAAAEEHRVLLSLLGYLGLRLGEALGLRLDDFDEKSRELTIERAWRRAALTTPKSEDGNRTLRLSAQMAELLVEHRRTVAGCCNPDGLMFPSRTGGHLDAAHWRVSVFHPAARAAGLSSHTTPHSLRHTAAVLQLRRHAPMDQVRATLGHSNIGTTMNLYGKRNAGQFEMPADAMPPWPGGAGRSAPPSTGAQAEAPDGLSFTALPEAA
jgi:integrase